MRISPLWLFTSLASAGVTAARSYVLPEEPFAKQYSFAPPSLDAVSAEAGTTLELSSIQRNQFTAFSHPAFPGRSARIKRSDFCDGGVASYTGYIDSGPKHFFFYFFESRGDPDKDDVVMWTNGGPGGSSSMGLFMELGPCNINSPNSTEYNPYSWNSNANIFFIDQPIGTGFSYHDFGELPSSSEDAGKDLAAFLSIFFETFSKFKGRSFHLSGESYAGRALPVYAAAIYDQNSALVANGLTPINLKSIMLGNGGTDFFHLIQSYYDIQCTNASAEPVQPISTCVRMKQILPRCESRLRKACVEHFDSIDCLSSFSYCMAELFQPYVDLDIGYNYYDLTKKCDTTVDCYPEQYYVEAYLNSPAIRSELGVDPSLGGFQMIATDVYFNFWGTGDQLHETKLYVAELLARGVKVLVYAGTLDVVCNWVGNERWTLDMEWAGRKEFASTPLRDWLVDGEPAGKTRTFGNLTFATIYGAGHLAPHDRPVQSLEMVKRWLADEQM
ncbi:hypothetical protein M0805_009173 [Coniferiporia weirii]|nr:hypothetical protein M0805_009173 [Coniferiporia weirii]